MSGRAKSAFATIFDDMRRLCVAGGIGGGGLK